MAFWSHGRIPETELTEPFGWNPVKLFPSPTKHFLPPVRMVTLISQS